MELERLDTLKEGDIKKFFQTFMNEEPEIFLFDKSGGSDIPKDMIFKLREEYNQSIDYYGSGNITRDRNGRLYVWNDKDTNFSRNHLEEYSKLHKHVKFEIR